MDNRDSEQYIAQLEKQLAFLEAKCVASLKSDGLRIADLEIKNQNLEARLKDLDKIEQLAFEAYVQTHPKAQEAILEMDRIVDMGAQDLYFNNLPSIKDARNRSKF